MPNTKITETFIDECMTTKESKTKKSHGVKHVTMIVRYSQVTTNVLLALMPTEPKIFA